MQKHKHFDTIIAWASGKRVQCKTQSGTWENVTWTPVWALDHEYRVAPETYSIGDLFIDPLEPGPSHTTKYMLVSVANDQVMLIVIDGYCKGVRRSDAKLKVNSCSQVPSDEFEATWPDLQKVEQ